VNLSTWRIVMWTAFLIVAAARPGIDAIDRWLVGVCWNIPSEWNAVAEAAMRTGVVESRVGGRPAPWRQASVLRVDGSRLAVVTVSDMTVSKSTFISEQYEVLGVLARTTSDAALVTDETRGYKPLSHIWPLVSREGRLHTLIAMAPLRSDPLRLGVFAYVALGATENELLFVCRLDAGPGPTWGELVANRDDGKDDMAVFERGQRGEPPIATFAWDARAGAYTAAVTVKGRALVSWWTPRAGEHVTVPRDVAIDDAIGRVAAGFRPSGR
jgi:hypothetical protein